MSGSRQHFFSNPNYFKSNRNQQSQKSYVYKQNIAPHPHSPASLQRCTEVLKSPQAQAATYQVGKAEIKLKSPSFEWQAPAGHNGYRRQAVMLTWAGSTPGDCTPCEWAWAFESTRSNSDEPSCGLSSSGSRILWIGSLKKDTALIFSTGRAYTGLVRKQNARTLSKVAVGTTGEQTTKGTVSCTE